MLVKEFDEFYYLDGLLFGRNAKEDLQKLSAALKPPTEEGCVLLRK